MVVDLEIVAYVDSYRSVVFVARSTAGDVVYWVILPVEEDIESIVGGHTLSIYDYDSGRHIAELKDAVVRGSLTAEFKISINSDTLVESIDNLATEDQDGTDEIPWIDVDNSKNANTALFSTGDAFDVYVDGARFLPDNINASKVTLLALSSDMSALEHENNSTLAQLDSPVYSPEYNLVSRSFPPSRSSLSICSMWIIAPIILIQHSP